MVVVLKIKICETKNYQKNSTNQLLENFKKSLRKVPSPFIDNIWGAGLADMQLRSKFNIRICFLLCVIDIVSKYVYVVFFKDKKGTTITNAFQ